MMQSIGDSEAPVLFRVTTDHIAVVTLNRPAVRNAINSKIAWRLDELVKRIEADENIRVAILASSHERVFCAGADLKEISEHPGDLLLHSTPDSGFAGFVDAQRSKPWIAAVRGAALAGGCELVLACDMIVASEDATFGLPEVKRGLFAGAGGVYRLPRVLPRHIAFEMIATGDPLSAENAARYGFVNRVAPSEGVLDTALHLAQQIAVNAPMSVRESLAAARLSAEKSDQEMRAISAMVCAKIFTSEDAQEGPRAFLEKRAPNWIGR